MRSRFDVFTREVAATVRDVVETIVTSPDSGRDVTYRAQGVPGLAPRLGQAATPSEQRVMRAWRGAPQMRENQLPETGTRQYLILATSFSSPTPITPSMGDSIVDDDGTWGIENVDTAEIGEPIHYVLSTRLRRVA